MGTVRRMESSPRKRAKSKVKPQIKAKPALQSKSAPKPAPKRKPKLLTGGNPQIAKADGDVPVQAYIAAMPGWKRDIGRQLDAITMQAVPGACKAVRWNSPFYGIDGQGWFLGLHCCAKYVKVAFFEGRSLRPMPPVESSQPKVRYFHIHEGETIDAAQFASWAKQASKLLMWGKT